MGGKRTWRQNIILGMAVCGVLLWCLFPFVQIVSTSFKHQFDWGNPSLLPSKMNFTAYRELLGFFQEEETVVPPSVRRILDRPDLSEIQKAQILKKYTSTRDVFPFPKYFANSLLLSSLAASFSVILSIFAAYAVSRLTFKGKEPVRRSILFVYMVGGVMLMVPLYQMSVKAGLAKTARGAWLSLLIIYVIQTLPVALYMLGNYFRSIPGAIEEAAAMDGYSRMQTLYKIVLPLSAPMVMTVLIYCFIIAWNEFLFASVFLKFFPDASTLPLALQSLFLSKNAIWDRIMAASVLTLIPVLLFFGVMTRHLTQGLMEGGIKS